MDKNAIRFVECLRRLVPYMPLPEESQNWMDSYALLADAIEEVEKRLKALEKLVRESEEEFGRLADAHPAFTLHALKMSCGLYNGDPDEKMKSVKENTSERS